MAGKKKIPKKIGKKSGGKKKEAEGGEATPEISVLDKNYYTTQIQALERNIDKLNQRCEQLTNAEKHAREQYRNLHQEKVDIVGFLRESLKSREDEIEELRSRLSGLVKARETELLKYDDKLKGLLQELDHTKADLSDQVLSLTRKLESLEEFRVQKEELENGYILLHTTLKSVQEEHKEKMSLLERSLIEESEALKKEQEVKLIQLTEKLRKDAWDEMHATTKAALTENEALSKSVATISSKVIKFRQKNIELGNELEEKQVREAMLQDSLVQMTSLAERRALVLAKVVKKADEHSRVFKEFEVVQEEKEKLKRYLQQMQIQLDTAVRLTCELRESSSEKGLALELLSTKLQEDKADRRKVTSVLNSALKLLQEGIFGVTDTAVASTDNTMGKVCGISNTTLTQLVDMLSSAEGVAIPDENPREERGDHHEKLASEPLVTYSAGDLGLVPKKAKGKHKPQ